MSRCRGLVDDERGKLGALPRPACGERVGVRGTFHALGAGKVPLTRQAGRGGCGARAARSLDYRLRVPCARAFVFPRLTPAIASNTAQTAAVSCSPWPDRIARS
jgi:hypothetical protein